jgi:DNA repair photolyase
MKNIEAKTILSKLNDSDWLFGISYSMNLYRGCQHGCIYCDSRSTCYHVENFDELEVKQNAIQLLEKELRKKRVKATIGTGSMNDPYMPIERKLGLTRRALEVLVKYRWPFHIITKGVLVERDIDLLKKASEVYAAVSFTVTTANDDLSRLIEPGAPVSSGRLACMKKLADAGIYTGVTLMPVLPYINDSLVEITELIHQCKENGAQYVLVWLGMTLREGQREYFYAGLDKHFPGLANTYRQKFGKDYSCAIPEADQKMAEITKLCQKLDLPMKMNFYNPPRVVQLDLFG